MEAHDAPHILAVPPHALATSGFWSYVTNTVFSTWIFLIIVVVCGVFLYTASRGKAGFIRTTGYLIVKHLKTFFEPLLGHNLPINKTLWFVGGVFIYILGSNLYSLLLDWVLAFSPQTWHDYLRPINSDINTTLGMAVLMILISHMIMVRFKGPI
jgi:F0F1-type ATP synthase membrane subunit a